MLKEAGVFVELYETKGTIHCFHIVSESELTKEAFKKRTTAL